MIKKEGIEVTGIWLLRLGEDVVVRAEIDGRWVEVIREYDPSGDASFSHIVESGGMREAAAVEPE
jgi:hypothetical protein